MKPVEFANYMLWDDLRRRRIRSRWKMTREDALARDPGAVLVPYSVEVRDLPDTDEERAALLRRPLMSGPPDAGG